MAKCSSSCSEELLTHKVRYLVKEFEICNKRLEKYQKAECEKKMKTISVQTTNSIFEAYDKLKREHKTLEKILRDNKERLGNKNTDHTRIIDETTRLGNKNTDHTRIIDETTRLGNKNTDHKG